MTPDTPTPAEPLKPCPFCGGEAKLWPASRGYAASVECTVCETGNPSFADISYPGDSAREAVEEWNRRATPAAAEPERSNDARDPTALERFNANATDDLDPLERLRFFCSLAMSGQDWLDVEPFFDALATQAAQQPKDLGVSHDGAGLSAPLRSAAIPDAARDVQSLRGRISELEASLRNIEAACNYSPYRSMNQWDQALAGAIYVAARLLPAKDQTC